MSSSDIPRLISEIKANAGEVLSVRDHPAERAAGALAEIGAPAVRPILHAMGEHFPRNQDPREVIEALGRILGAIAIRDPTPLLEVLARDEVPPDPQMLFVVFALRHSRDERATAAVIEALRHWSPTVRYGAVDVLVQRGGKRILDALLPVLKDRSSQVKFVIVEAMRRRADLRDSRALGALKRITTNRSLKKHSPGLCEYAREVIGMIEAGPSGRRPR